MKLLITMNAVQNIPEVSKEVFEALLLIYASHTDLEFSKVDKSQIVTSFGYDTYESANQLFGKLREYELLRSICDLRQLYYPGTEGKNQILGMVKTHFKVDGDFSKLERTQFDFLKMML
tara:strand:- start:9721 stop:10077 length:357 start_codon:yes stop_codon:yes gene_type:complete